MAPQVPPAPWLAPARARSLHVRAPADLDRIAAALRDALATWPCDWGLAGQAAQLQCTRYEAPETAGPWHAGLGSDGRAMAWLQAPALDLLALLFAGAQQAGPVARSVCAACADDAAARLARALQVRWAPQADAAPPACEAARWSGAVRIDLPLLPAWRLVIAGTAAAAWVQPKATSTARAPRRPLAGVAAALAQRPLPLQVRLDGCELALGALQALGAGDVVALRHPLAAPALVTDAGGQPCLSAYLARRQGRKAIELAAPADAPQPQERSTWA